MNLLKSLTLLTPVVLAGCLALEGEPAKPQEVATGLVYHSVHRKILFEGYLENQYIFHRPDGRATFFKQVNTAQGYSRETRVGTWKPAPGQVCYSWKSGNECKKVNMSSGKIVAEHGEVRYRDVGGTQRRNGLNVVEPPHIANASSLGAAIANSPIGDALRAYGKAVQAVCGSNGCQDEASGSTATSASKARSPSAASASSNSVAAPRVKRIENWGTSPDGSSPQYKITCGNGTTHRYWRQGGEWAGPFGTAGLRGLSIEDLAKKRCG